MPEIALIKQNFTTEDRRNFERFIAILVELAMKNGLKTQGQKTVTIPEPSLLLPLSEETRASEKEKVLIPV